MGQGMTRNEKLRQRMEEERRQSPWLSLRDLAKKLNLSELAVLGLLGEGQARKVRRDLEDLVLDEIRTWGTGSVQIHHDWAEAVVTCDLGSLTVVAGLLTVKKDSSCFRIDYGRVESIYFVEFGQRSSVQFFNKKGRLVFEVLPPADPGFMERFQRLRGSFSATLMGAKS